MTKMLWVIVLALPFAAAGCGSLNAGLEGVSEAEYSVADGIGDLDSGIDTFGDNVHDTLWAW